MPTMSRQSSPGNAAALANVAPAPDWSALCPRLFLAIAGIFLPLYALLLAPLQVPDEWAHIIRAYGVSELHFLGPVTTSLPASFVALRTRFEAGFDSDPQRRIVTAGELARWWRQPLQANVTSEVRNPNADVYSFVPYLGTASVMAAGRALDWSPARQIYAARLLNGAIYLCLMFLALRLLPDFHLLLFLVALTPMALAQGASPSVDSPTIALTALFVALIFRLAFRAGAPVVRPKDELFVIGVIVVLSLCKFNPLLTALALLIPPDRFTSRRRRILFVGACVAAACMTPFVWQQCNHAAVSAYQAARGGNGRMVAANLAFILHHPIRFGAIILYTNVVFSWIWAREFVGVFGWLSIWPHPVVVLLYAGTVIFALLTQPANVVLSGWQKKVLDHVVLLSFLTVSIFMWIVETRVKTLHDAADSLQLIPGIQGRYFLPLALPLFAALSRRRLELTRWRVLGIALAIAAVNAGSVFAIWANYR